MAEQLPEFWGGRRVLVTGGLGFIGSNLAIDLVAQHAQVTIVDLPRLGFGGHYKNIAAIEGQVEIHEVDVRDDLHMEHLIADNEVIFCLAGQVSHSRSMAEPLLDLDLNCRSPLAMLEMCRRANRSARIVFAGTRQVYGRPDYLPVDEQHPLRPVDVNGITKLATEQFLRLYHELYGLHTVSLRLTNTYGPRMDLRDPAKGFIGVFLNRAFRGQVITLFGDGEQRRDYNHVDDVVQALKLAARCDSVAGGAYNLAHPESHSLTEFVDFLDRLVGVRREHIPFPQDRKAIDVGDYQGDSRLFHSLTGWEPEIGLEEGLRQTVEYYRRKPQPVG